MISEADQSEVAQVDAGYRTLSGEACFNDRTHDVYRGIEAGPGFELCRRLLEEHLDPADGLGALCFGLGDEFRFHRVVDGVEDDCLGRELWHAITERGGVDVGMHAD